MNLGYFKMNYLLIESPLKCFDMKIATKDLSFRLTYKEEKAKRNFAKFCRLAIAIYNILKIRKNRNITVLEIMSY